MQQAYKELAKLTDNAKEISRSFDKFLKEFQKVFSNTNKMTMFHELNKELKHIGKMLEKSNDQSTEINANLKSIEKAIKKLDK